MADENDVTEVEEKPLEAHESAAEAAPAAAVEEPEEAPAVEPPPRPEPPKWALSRISEETSKRQAVEKRLQAAEDMLAQMRQPKSDAPQPGAQPVHQPDFEAAVGREANLRQLHSNSLAVRNAGMAAFPNFQDSLSVLTAVGATQNDFVSDLLAVDQANAHVLLDRLAKDPDQAAALARMDSRSRTAHLTRMSMAEQPPRPQPEPGKPPRVSAAPPPKPVIDSSKTNDGDWMADDASPETFKEGYSKSKWGKMFPITY